MTWTMLLYEIANEAGSYSTKWQYHMIDFIRQYEAGKPKQHPVGMTYQYAGGSDSTLFGSSADWISPQSAFPSSDGTKVIINDTDHSFSWSALKSSGLAAQQACDACAKTATKGFCTAPKCIAFGAPGGRENDVPVIMWIHLARCNHALDRTRSYWCDAFIGHMSQFHQLFKGVSTFGRAQVKPFSMRVFSKIPRREFGHLAGDSRMESVTLGSEAVTRSRTNASRRPSAKMFECDVSLFVSG
jgi:hypothetical protein